MYVKRYEDFDTNVVVGYRYINQKYNADFDGVQFFAKNEKYAKLFGSHLYVAKISLDNSMNLEYWNTLLREKGANDFAGQGQLTIHSDYFNSNSDRFEYREARNEIYYFLGGQQLSKFVKELRTADVIIGEDAGHPGEIVYAVKNRNSILD